ncbi:hypothetical protein RHECNPAF_12210057 [Rhizobium etli CNPAF512]|nr:hypothetical protein RHECNPAF_12210057 [Rhizobium etli CNPAF512]
MPSRLGLAFCRSRFPGLRSMRRWPSLSPDHRSPPHSPPAARFCRPYSQRSTSFPVLVPWTPPPARSQADRGRGFPARNSWQSSFVMRRKQREVNLVQGPGLRSYRWIRFSTGEGTLCRRA